MKSPLGRLEPVDLRTYWEREDTHFTPWLAQDDNIAILGEAIGIELEVQDQEVGVGPFRADIVCRNVEDNALVLIENQLERTDHGHLGQLLTYAAGLEAATLVWVVRRFTEEHRATLDWLNRITEEGFHFFGVEIELWRIGDSPPAPKFNIVAKPNAWTRVVREGAHLHGASETASLKTDFWSTLADHFDAVGSKLRRPAARPYNWQGWGLGRSFFQLAAAVNIRDARVAVYVNLSGPDVEAHFQLLIARRGEIESKLGFPLEWERGEQERKLIVRHDCATSDRTRWPEQHQWLHQKLVDFDRVFRPIVAELDASEWRGEGP